MPHGDWIETYTGHKFYSIDPRPEDICIEDIAHALSLICRFNGHCKFFYSVAQHSLGVQEDMAKAAYTEEWQLYGLLHDAAETYIADVSRPIKPFLRNYRDIEKKLQDEIYRRFGLAPLSSLPDEIADTIKLFDDMILGAEGRVLINNTDGWVDKFQSSNRDILYESPAVVECRFLSRFGELARDKPG